MRLRSAHPSARETFRSECDAIAAAIEAPGVEALARMYAASPARALLREKDRVAYEAFVRNLSELPSNGLALTVRGVQRERPSLFDLRDELSSIDAPTLLIVGDEDPGCLQTSLMLRETLPSASLLMLPNTGHTVNLEEPMTFNASVARFLGERLDRREPSG